MKGTFLPILRFPEFTEPWQEKRGRELFSNRRLRGKYGLPIYSVTLTNGLGPRDSLARQFGGDAEIESHLRAKPDDLVYNMMRMWQGAVGRAEVECLVSPAYVVLAPAKEINSTCFAYYLQRARSLYNLWAYSYGLTDDRLRLYYRDFGFIKFRIPQPAEQEKIATVLATVDQKIEALRRKRELLQSYKRGMLQKIFSQELRFKADDGTEFPEWKEKTIGETAVVQMGQSPDSLSYNDCGIGVPLIQGNADLTNGLTNPRRFTSEPTKICEENDIIISVRAPVGEVALAIHRACLGRGVCSIRARINHSNTYLYQWLLWFEKQWVRIGQGSTFTAINGDDIKKLKILMPVLKEQQTIADFLSAIDAKIDAVAGQIAKMEQFKKGLLQQLFC